jgi:hypothetical protein
MSTEAEALGDRIAELAAHLDAATHRLLTDLRDYDRTGNWHEQGAQSCAHWLSWKVGWSLGTARDHLRVANRLGDLPLIDDALRLGQVSYSKVRAMVRVATTTNEAMLLEDARHATGQHLELICRKYAIVVRAAKEVDEDYDREHRTLTRRDLEDGMVRLSATLRPEEAAVVWAALDQIARERAMREQLAAQMGIEWQDSTSSAITGDPRPRGSFNRVDALVAMGQSVLRGDAPRRSPVELVVTVAAETLMSASTPIVGSPRGGVACAGSAELHPPTTQIADGTASPERTTAVNHVGLRGSAEPHRMAAGGADGTPSTERTTTAPRATPGVSAETPLTPAVVADVMTLPLTYSDTTRGSAEPLAPFAVFADGTCVSAETVRRLACDCGVVHMVEDADGKALSVGRKRRTIPASMKRAMQKRDGCCRFPGCTNRLYVEGHHIQHWADGGETALDNLLALCGFHHRFVHEYGCRVELDEAQQPRFFDRGGRVVVEVLDPPPREGLGVPQILARNASLDIDADTNACLWDGERMQLGDVIDALVRADGL